MSCDHPRVMCEDMLLIQAGMDTDSLYLPCGIDKYNHGCYAGKKMSAGLFTGNYVQE